MRLRNDDDEMHSLDTTRALIADCEAEAEHPAAVLLLRARFTRLLTESITRQVLDMGQFCRAFALGAADAALSARDAWAVGVILRIAKMCAFNGDLEEARDLAVRCLQQSPESPDVISLWAELAPSDTEVIDRYMEMAGASTDRAEVLTRARTFASHSAAPERLGPYVDEAIRRLAR